MENVKHSNVSLLLYFMRSIQECLVGNQKIGLGIIFNVGGGGGGCLHQPKGMYFSVGKSIE